MTEAAYKVFVRKLRLDGVVLEGDRDRLRVNSPKGVVTSRIEETLRELKPDLLELLSLEQRIVDMSLSDFEQQNHAIEVRVTWLEDTLWFVPHPDHIRILLNDGVRRGRIWTSRELADLMSLSKMPRRDLMNIASFKAAFGAEIVTVESTKEADRCDV